MTDEEINEAVAKKLGWVYDGTDWYSPTGLQCNMADHLRDYCHSIEAAWEIVRYLELKGICWEFRGDGSGKAGMGFGDQHRRLVFEEAISAPMAICLAFLKLDALA